MSISISEFKAWVGQNQNAAVSVVDGALADASNQIGVVDRMFRRGTVNSVRSAAMKEFTRALSARYGVTIAQQAITHAGLTSKSELTGRKISAVVESAKKLRADMLALAERYALYVTAGSDYHGKNKLVTLGETNYAGAQAMPEGMRRFLEAVGLG